MTEYALPRHFALSPFSSATHSLHSAIAPQLKKRTTTGLLTGTAVILDFIPTLFALDFRSTIPQ
jgi:hypothetical protein